MGRTFGELQKMKITIEVRWLPSAKDNCQEKGAVNTHSSWGMGVLATEGSLGEAPTAFRQATFSTSLCPCFLTWRIGVVECLHWGEVRAKIICVLRISPDAW